VKKKRFLSEHLGISHSIFILFSKLSAAAAAATLGFVLRKRFAKQRNLIKIISPFKCEM
jgi:hypothetical protein